MFVVMIVEASLLVMVLYMVFLLVMESSDKDEDMVSSYECGFDSMMGSRVGFSYRFFLISILFLIFDVEVTLMIPLPFVSLEWWWVGGVWWFLVVLLGGLLYEYYNGVLSWMVVENV